MLEQLPSTAPRALVGGKAGGLSDLIRWGFDVPAAFVLRADAPDVLDDDAARRLCAAAQGTIRKVE